MPTLGRMRLHLDLGPEHTATGNTRHTVGGEPMPLPASLEIVDREGEGFYLLYLDASGEEMTDTWHQTLDDAKHQAEFEFNVRPGDWPKERLPLFVRSGNWGQPTSRRSRPSGRARRTCCRVDSTTSS